MFNITLDYTGKKHDLLSDIIINLLQLKEYHLEFCLRYNFTYYHQWNKHRFPFQFVPREEILI